MNTAVVPRRRHQIVTPEGLRLALEIAPAGDRLSAFALDFLAMMLVTILATLVLFFPAVALGGGGSEILAALSLICTFVIWNGYFLYYELRWRGVTPGKRRIGLKVVARNGGPLSTGAVFSRNLLRQLEFFFPLQALLSLSMAAERSPQWLLVMALLWLAVLLVLPLLNRDRARCGDLVAGTLVVVRPEVRLMPDPADMRDQDVAEPQAGYTFTNEQLDMYGIRELQVLEDILRHDARRVKRRTVLRKVCDKIVTKVAWPEPVPDAEVLAFLQAFYRAQRNRLEQRLLLGERREKKRAGRLDADGKVVDPFARPRRKRHR